MKPLIVGQAPGRNGNGEPLSGACGRRLAALCDMPLSDFIYEFDRVNLFSHWPGKAGKGDAFPLAEARERARAMAEKIAAREQVVLLGWNVARAFRFTRVDFFEWSRLSRDCGEVAVAPHPSGVSRWWNDEGNVARARWFWLQLSGGAPRERH